MNWTVLIIVGIILVALVVFLIARNMQDKKKLEEQIKEDYPKPKESEHEIEIEDRKNP